MFNQKVLVVDDSKVVLSIVKKDIDLIGIKKYALAMDGEEAWNLIEAAVDTEPFTMVICDWIMPKSTGLDLLRKIRLNGDSKISNLTFLMITGAPEKVKDAMEAGADNFIAKPFSAQDLKNKLQFILRQKSKLP